MLENIYITLVILAFSLLTTSLIINKDVGKILLSALSSGIFFTLSLSSTYIEVVYCNSLSCTAHNFFYQDLGFLFMSLGWLSAILSFAFVLLMITEIISSKKLENEVI